MRVREVLRVLDALEARGVASWVLGGWGVDALVGRQTREHRDLDLAVRAEQLDPALAALATLGYAAETDWLPVRVELASDAGWVDVHPVVFDASGHGVQAGLDGATFDYPAEALQHGVIGGRTVPCISAAHQISVHSGYELRAQDVHDLAQLRALSS